MGLKGISPLISPDLLHALAAMGHGDEIVFTDLHFPTSSTCKHGAKELRSDGHSIPELLKAILPLFPLDTYDDPVYVMELVPSDVTAGMARPGVWKKYEEIVAESEGRKVEFKTIERFAFYERAKNSFAVVHTGETAQYGNIILKKGVMAGK